MVDVTFNYIFITDYYSILTQIHVKFVNNKLFNYVYIYTYNIGSGNRLVAIER